MPTAEEDISPNGKDMSAAEEDKSPTKDGEEEHLQIELQQLMKGKNACAASFCRFTHWLWMRSGIISSSLAIRTGTWMTSAIQKTAKTCYGFSS